jgi:hypothetical protein
MLAPSRPSASHNEGNRLPHQREIAVGQTENAKADHPDGKECQRRLLTSGHRSPTLLKGQIHVNQ